MTRDHQEKGTPAGSGEITVSLEDAERQLNVNRLKVVRHRAWLLFDALVMDFLRNEEVRKCMTVVVVFSILVGWIWGALRLGAWLLGGGGAGLLVFILLPIVSLVIIGIWWEEIGKFSWRKIKDGWNGGKTYDLDQYKRPSDRVEEEDEL